MPVTLVLNNEQPSPTLERLIKALKSCGYGVTIAACLREASRLAAERQSRKVVILPANGTKREMMKVTDNCPCKDTVPDADQSEKNLPLDIQSRLPRHDHDQSADMAMPSTAAATATRLMLQHYRVKRPMILCVDDDLRQLELRGRLLESAGYRVLAFDEPVDAIAAFSRGYADAVLLDYAMPVMNGSAVARQMRLIRAEVPLILLSGATEIPAQEVTLFDRYVRKSESPASLLAIVGDVLSGARPEQTSAS